MKRFCFCVSKKKIDLICRKSHITNECIMMDSMSKCKKESDSQNLSSSGDTLGASPQLDSVLEVADSNGSPKIPPTKGKKRRPKFVVASFRDIQREEEAKMKVVNDPKPKSKPFSWDQKAKQREQQRLEAMTPEELTIHELQKQIDELALRRKALLAKALVIRKEQIIDAERKLQNWVETNMVQLIKYLTHSELTQALEGTLFSDEQRSGLLSGELTLKDLRVQLDAACPLKTKGESDDEDNSSLPPSPLSSASSSSSSSSQPTPKSKSPINKWQVARGDRRKREGRQNKRDGLQKSNDQKRRARKAGQDEKRHSREKGECNMCNPSACGARGFKCKNKACAEKPRFCQHVQPGNKCGCKAVLPCLGYVKGDCKKGVNCNFAHETGCRTPGGCSGCKAKAAGKKRKCYWTGL